MTVDTGGNAFPTEDVVHKNPENEQHFCFPGMTLLDYFAGQILAACTPDNIIEKKLGVLAANAYMVAQAMIAEKRRREKSDGK